MQPITRSEVTEAFSKMEGSEIARVYYSSRAHKEYGSEGPRLDFTQSSAAIMVYGSVWNDYHNGDNVWSNTFSFTAFGESFADYLGL